MRKKDKGYLLLLVLGVGSLMFLAGIAAVSLSSQDALQQRFLEHNLEARCASESGIADALAELTKNPNFNGELAKRKLEGGAYQLDFLETNCRNNLLGGQAMLQDGHAVPPGTAYLVSNGSEDGCKVQSGAIVSLGEVLFDDDFSQPAPGWVANRPNLTVYLLGKWVLDLKLLDATRLLKGDESWRNYTYETTVLVSQVTDMGFMVRANGDPAAPSGYVVGYNLLEATLSGGTFFLSRMENGVYVERIQQKRGSELGLGGLVWLLNLYHTYKITVIEDKLVATVDGREIINATLTNPIKTGRVGLLPGLASLMLIDRAKVSSVPEIRSRWRSL